MERHFIRPICVPLFPVNLWQKISNIGLAKQMEPDEIRSLHLVNRTILIGTIVSFGVTPLIYLQGNWIGVISQLVTGFLLIAGFLFSLNHRYNAAMVYILIVFMCNLTLASLLTHEILVEFFLIPLSVAAPAILKSNRIAIIMFLACLGNYLLIETINEHKHVEKLVQIEPFLIDITYVIDGVLIFAITFLMFIVLRQTNAAYGRRIVAQKEHIEEQNHEIRQSINYARRIQKAILPPDSLFRTHLPQSFVLYKPKDIVAGDFYFLEVAGEEVIFAACDCTGHGVPGAMVSVICNNALRRSVREYGLREPAAILDQTRLLVISEFDKSVEQVQDGMDISLCVYRAKTRELKWAGANNPLWILRKGAAEMEMIKPDKQPIAHYDNIKPFNGHTTILNPGDTFYIFSDGYQDQFGGPNRKKFRPARLKDNLIAMAQKSMTEQQILLNTDFEKWKGELEQVDDVCVIGIRV